MKQIIDLIINNGMAVVLMAYFIFKDWKFNDNVLNVLQEMREVLAQLKTFHERSGSDDN